MLHASSRTAKIAGVAALAGLMMTAAIVAGTTPAPPPVPLASAVRKDGSRSRLEQELGRCAALTMPDSGCEAAWVENRRRFFQQGDPSASADWTIAP